MQKNYRPLTYSFILLFTCICLFAQSQSEDSILLATAIKKVKSQYQISIKENLLLFNGSEYGKTVQQSKGFPFFDSENLLNGSIFFDDKLYEDLNFQYDLTLDKVIINDFKKNYLITLATEKINYFIINGHEFVRLSINANKSAGFYERLNKGNISLWAKREKKLVLPANAEEKTPSFIQYDHYLIQKNETLYPAESENSILLLLKDKNDELKKYIIVNKIKFKKQFELSAIKVINYYNQLIH